MNSADWQIWIAECRKQELPCIPTTTEPWFSAQYVCGNFLCIERADRFIREWKDLGLPMLRIKNHPLIRMSDVERYGMATAAVDEQPEQKSAGRKRSVPGTHMGRKPKARLLIFSTFGVRIAGRVTDS